MKEVKTIEAYSLAEFCMELQGAVLDGWRLDLDSNENYPASYGSHLIAGLVKSQEQSEEKVEVKPGRKAKNS